MGAVNRPVQERILSAADKLFYSEGIRAVGVDAIAEEARVSKRTLYSYYHTKDDLVAAYLPGRFKQLTTPHQPPGPTRPPPPPPAASTAPRPPPRRRVSRSSPTSSAWSA